MAVVVAVQQKHLFPEQFPPTYDQMRPETACKQKQITYKKQSIRTLTNYIDSTPVNCIDFGKHLASP